MKIIRSIVWFFFILLVITNGYVFIESMRLGNEVTRYEREIKKLYLENLDLENKVSSLDSLKFAASLADRLDFTKKSEPILLNNLIYAKK